MATRPMLALLAALPAACTSNHNVSPFPPLEAISLRPTANLEGQLSRIEGEVAKLSLREEARVTGRLREGEPLVAVGLRGRDALGRDVFAVRVATPYAIVLAKGPARLAHEASFEPARLLPSLGPEGAFPSGSDLTGDKLPDVVLVAPSGRLAVFAITPLGASRYPVKMRFSPTKAEDVDGDGRPDLIGTMPVDASDPLAPELSDVAICTGDAFSSAHPSAQAWHRRRRDRPRPPRTAPLAARLKAELERAFHDGCAGAAPEVAFAEAARLAGEHAPLPEGLSSAWVRWRGALADALASPPRED